VTIDPSASRKIDRYIYEAADFAQPICTKLREIIRKADPKIVEDWKWGPNFNKDGMVCGFGACKSHVTLTFFRGAAMKDPKKILAGCSDDNAHNRSIKFRGVDEIDEKTLSAYVREATAINSKGITVPLRRAQIPSPPDLQEALDANTKAKNFFDGLTPGYRREFIAWVVEAKRPETRERRIRESLAMLAEGRRLHDEYR